MDLDNRRVLILGGSGLVGLAVARKILEHRPAEVVLVALREEEVERGKAELEPVAGETRILTEWGNIFVPADAARMEISQTHEREELRRLILNDMLDELSEEILERSFLHRVLTRHRPEAVVDCINTATAFAYLNVFQSARALLDSSRNGKLSSEDVERHLLTLTMPQLIRHIQILLEGMKRSGTLSYVKIGTSGTGGMGLNIPYTHSEEKPSRTLLTKSAVAGAQTLLLFLMGRTPGAPGVAEVKPTATIGWKEIEFGPVTHGGRPIERYDCPEPVDPQEALSGETDCWVDCGGPLESVYANMGENGVFAREEFETVTSLGSMELITAEDVAEYVVAEILGRPTGRDVVSALDAASAGPTYRAGILRAAAIERLESLEREHEIQSVAFEMLGPPRLTKLLFEAHILGRLCDDISQLAAADPGDLASRAQRVIREDANLRSSIVSVGLPIVVDGPKIYRAGSVMVPPVNGDFETAVPRGWVDLREGNQGVWVARAAKIIEQSAARVGHPRGTGSDLDWLALGPADPVKPSRLATWIFKYEDDGERIKR